MDRTNCEEGFATDALLRIPDRLRGINVEDECLTRVSDFILFASVLVILRCFIFMIQTYLQISRILYVRRNDLKQRRFFISYTYLAEFGHTLSLSIALILASLGQSSSLDTVNYSPVLIQIPVLFYEIAGSLSLIKLLHTGINLLPKELRNVVGGTKEEKKSLSSMVSSYRLLIFYILFLGAALAQYGCVFASMYYVQQGDYDYANVLIRFSVFCIGIAYFFFVAVIATQTSRLSTYILESVRETSKNTNSQSNKVIQIRILGLRIKNFGHVGIAIIIPNCIIPLLVGIGVVDMHWYLFLLMLLMAWIVSMFNVLVFLPKTFFIKIRDFFRTRIKPLSSRGSSSSKDEIVVSPISSKSKVESSHQSH